MANLGFLGATINQVLDILRGDVEAHKYRPHLTVAVTVSPMCITKTCV